MNHYLGLDLEKLGPQEGKQNVPTQKFLEDMHRGKCFLPTVIPWSLAHPSLGQHSLREERPDLSHLALLSGPSTVAALRSARKGGCVYKSMYLSP